MTGWLYERRGVFLDLLAVAGKSDVDLGRGLHDSMTKYENRIARAAGPDVRRSRDLE